jgi:hypothetical protein
MVPEMAPIQLIKGDKEAALRHDTIYKSGGFIRIMPDRSGGILEKTAKEEQLQSTELTLNFQDHHLLRKQKQNSEKKEG